MGGLLGGGVLGEIVEMERWRDSVKPMDGDRRCSGMVPGLTTWASGWYDFAGGILVEMVEGWQCCSNG